MKVSAKGMWSLTDVADKLSALFQSMVESGIDGVVGTTLYINPYSGGRPTQFLSEWGHAIETFDFVETRRVYKPSMTSGHRLNTEVECREYLAKLHREVARMEEALANMDAREIKS